MEYFFAVLAA